MMRKFRKTDLPSVLRIEESIQVAPWSTDVFEQCMNANCSGWVIQENKKILGFILVSVQVEECHILNLGVDRLYQRQGYGRQLLEQAIRESRHLGAGIAYLEVRETNSRAIRLYQALGFIQIGVRKDYYPVPTGRENALIFAKDLQIQIK